MISSFWTSRGHRCRPFPPAISAFIFIAQRVQYLQRSSITSNFSHSRSRAFGSSSFEARKGPYKHEHALGETRTHNWTVAGTRFTNYKVAPPGTPLCHSSSCPTMLPCLNCCAEGLLGRAPCATAAATAADLLLLLRAAAAHAVPLTE